MIKKVFKYQLKIQTEQEIELPLHSRVLSVKNQRNSIVLYAEVREDIKETKKIKVFLVCTGDRVPSEATLFLDTILLNDGIYVLHVYLNGSQFYWDSLSCNKQVIGKKK